MKAFWDKDSSQNRNFLFKCACWSKMIAAVTHLSLLAW
jgi:hypothetical protein